jgi:N-dimethylarginine dimethylaminohydrolase
VIVFAAYMTDVGPWSRVIVHHAREAFVSPDVVAREWRGLHFTHAPDFGRAVAEYDAFVDVLSRAGASVEAAALRRSLPDSAPDLTLDAIYVRDASVMTPQGAVLCQMGKPQRSHEPDVLRQVYIDARIPVLGRIEAPGCLEGGDATWLSPGLLAVGQGYRTNAEGIRQLRALVGPSVEVIDVGLPHYRGPGDVFHLMSILSPVDRDLAVVYSPLMPVPFRERLLELEYRLVEVPDEEFDSMGANVFAAAPGRAVMVAGNPVTRARLEAAGAEVFEYDGTEISLKGGGGPTCLTRPIP